jgi:hypothetical protein
MNTFASGSNAILIDATVGAVSDQTALSTDAA